MSSTSEKSISVNLTEHAERRISERFGTEDIEEIEGVLRQTVTNGLITEDGDGGYLIEHGCLVVAVKRVDGNFNVDTVYNLAEGISEGLKRKLDVTSPTPWDEGDILIRSRGEES